MVETRVFFLVIVKYIYWKVQIHIWNNFFPNRVSVFTLVTMVTSGPQNLVKNEQWQKSSIWHPNESNQTNLWLERQGHALIVSQLKILASQINFVSIVDLRIMYVKQWKKRRKTCLSSKTQLGPAWDHLCKVGNQFQSNIDEVWSAPARAGGGFLRDFQFFDYANQAKINSNLG